MQKVWDLDGEEGEDREEIAWDLKLVSHCLCVSECVCVCVFDNYYFFWLDLEGV